MNPKLIRYYKKKLYGGRSLIARASDFIMLRVFLLFFIFIIVLTLSLSTIVALLISVFLTTATSLLILVINRKKVEKFILKDLKRIKQKCLLEKLTLMNIKDYTEYINTLFEGRISDIEITPDGFCGKYDGNNIYVMHNHPSAECSVSDALGIYRMFGDGKSITIISLSEFSADAAKMCCVMPVKTNTIDGNKILEMAEEKGMLPDEEEARANALKEMNETAITLEDARNAALGKTKVKGYIICGIVVMCWPLITGFRVYYPIISIICFILAAVSYRYSKRCGKESSGTEDKLT
jgi:hypothetical protein